MQHYLHLKHTKTKIAMVDAWWKLKHCCGWAFKQGCEYKQGFFLSLSISGIWSWNTVSFVCLFCLLLFLKGNDNTIVLMWLVFISEQTSGVVKAYDTNTQTCSVMLWLISVTLVCFCLFSSVIARKPGEVLMIHLYYSGLSFFFFFSQDYKSIFVLTASPKIVRMC